MMLEGWFEYKKALILTPERINELEKILLKYSESVSYEGKTVANTAISFTSMDELLIYDNLRNRKLKSLTVIGKRNKYERVVTCEFEAGGLGILVGYDETCVCSYNVSNVDIETTLREDIQTFLKKITARYWLFGKFRIVGLMMALCLLLVSYILNVGVKRSGNLDVKVFLFTTIAGILIARGAIMIDRYVIRELFPPLSFLWGEAVDQGKRMEVWRSNLFWVIIVGILLAILGPKMYEMVF